jgi:hypothetical protein
MTEELLDRWADVKQRVKRLQDEEERIKEEVDAFMNDQKTDTLASSRFIATKREQERSYMSKKDTPPDIWNEFARVTRFPVIYLNVNPQNRTIYPLRRSRRRNLRRSRSPRRSGRVRRSARARRV